MRKVWVILASLVIAFWVFTINDIGAKSATLNNIEVTFGDEDSLGVYYSKISSFNLDNYHFYYDGKEHVFNSDYTLVDSSIVVNDSSFVLEGETFTLNIEEKTVVSTNAHETYMLPVSVNFNSDDQLSYEFKQQLCYKYLEVEDCKIDQGDISEITGSANYNYYYSFLPFYNSELTFDYLEYNFTLSNESETLSFPSLRFVKEEIQYLTESFEIYNYSQDNNIKSYKDKYFIRPYSMSDSNKYVYIYTIENFLVDTNRKYTLNFYSCVGEAYDNCENIDTREITTNGLVYRYLGIDLTNINKEDGDYYRSFLLKVSYVCQENCGAGARKELTYSEGQIYYLNLTNPSLTQNAVIEGSKLSCGYMGAYCYGIRDEVTNKIEYYDDNGIEEIYYTVVPNQINDDSLINKKINNGDEITINLDSESGFYYLYLKVIDGTGTTFNYSYTYFLDKTGPYLASSNFEDYSSDYIYSEVKIVVTFTDERFQGWSYDTYYLVVKESEYQSLTRETIIEANNLYNNGVDLQNYVNEDGKYRVCFVSKDYLNNYSEIVCSNSYYLDFTPLTKEEVVLSVVSNEEYLAEIAVRISIPLLEDSKSFSCGLILKGQVIESESELGFTCLNNQVNELALLAEGEYSLWIYASDAAGNYALLNLDTEYRLDNLAPRISYIINGDNESYNNNVKVKVVAEDISEISYSSYGFYLLSYNESNFTDFELNEEISYPLDYYGEYKLAIKVCDSLNNCSVKTSDETFYIDTGIVTLALNGDKQITILRFSRYEELGAIATKGNAGRVSERLDYVIEGEVDNSKAGTYYLTYSAGEGQNKVSITREVIVKESKEYLVWFFALFVGGGIILSLRLIFVKSKKYGKM